MKTNVVEKVDTEIKIKVPDTYQIVIYNNPTTTMEGVVLLLLEVFSFPTNDAIRLMAQIHLLGKGVAFTGPRDLAEQIQQLALAFCKEQQEFYGLMHLEIKLELVP